MDAIGNSKSIEIRRRLNHPILDSDGHWLEFEPAFLDYLKDVAGAEMVTQYQSWQRNRSIGVWYRLTPEERRDMRALRPIWWGVATKNTLDRATATLPKLLYERLDETGIDFTVIYPSLGLFAPRIDDADLRRAACRAFNKFSADSFRDYSDRMTPAAIIPMHTPQEALEELDYAVNTLGLKTLFMADYAMRPIPYVERKFGEEAGRFAYWLDFFTLDSQYDYDPVWAKCVELKVVPGFHSQGFWGGRASPSNFVYNHIGHFAAAGEAMCRGLFMGGVTRRFPSLKFAFLECGVGWGVTLYSDLIGHWEKRNIKAMENYDPANLDEELFVDLCRQYGGRIFEGRLNDAIRRASAGLSSREDPAMLDEFAPCRINDKREIKDLFVPHFYFGCEADDPVTAWAFDTKKNPYGAKLNAIFSSDIGHWDVVDIRGVTAEAYELIEHGLLNEDEFRDFMFTNAVRMWGSTNPDFFKGTVVESEAAKVLSAGKPGTTAGNDAAATVRSDAAKWPLRFRQ
jgi:predicted TIM-barrel fold metal-dependent hydrolase